MCCSYIDRFSLTNYFSITIRFLLTIYFTTSLSLNSTWQLLTMSICWNLYIGTPRTRDRDIFFIRLSTKRRRFAKSRIPLFERFFYQSLRRYNGAVGTYNFFILKSESAETNQKESNWSAKAKRAHTSENSGKQDLLIWRLEKQRRSRNVRWSKGITHRVSENCWIFIK